MPGIIFTSMNRSVSTSKSTSFYRKLIYFTFNKYELPQPVFEEIQNGFKVSVFKTTQRTQTRDLILELLSKNPKMTREDLAKALTKSPI